MNLPLYMQDAFGFPAAMALGTLFGFAFGFVLERAGFGRANVLVAQFYGDDNRVLKVMFSAIVTATVGLGLLSGLGMVNVSLLSIPDTFVGPHIVGGLLLGVGFVVSGYCPGTALVSTGSGNIDGLYSILGTMAGAVVFALGYPALESFYLSGALGRLTLPDVLGVSWQVVALGVVAMAVGAFLAVERLEGWLSRRSGKPAPAGNGRTRNMVFAGFAGVGLAALGVLALPTGPAPQAAMARVGHISPLALADTLVSAPDSLWLVDLRPPAECAAASIPRAICLPEDDLEGAFLKDLPATRRLVVFAAGDLDTLPTAAHRFGGPVSVLDGGRDAFAAMVLSAPDVPETATPEAIAAYQHRSALHAWFTGSTTRVQQVVVAPKAVTRTVKKGGGC